MNKEINLVFHKKGLRSFIEVDLCCECPRQDNKGCCGYYSPVFYPTDLAYYLYRYPHLIDLIFSSPRLTILDASVTVNNEPDIDEAYHCQFHTLDKGCLLAMDERESICRHFVCPGIGWWEESGLYAWKEYFDRLADFEIALNNSIAARLKESGITLRRTEDRQRYLDLIKSMVDSKYFEEVPFGQELPEIQAVKINRNMTLGSEWIL
ncbi:MAG: hypothetical protein ACM3MK_12760 [Chitinophagales bacterium]